MTPLESFVEWLEAVPAVSGYTLSRGMWQDDESAYQTRFIALMAGAGRAPGIIERYPVVRVLVLGKRGERNVAGAVAELEAFANSLIEQAAAVPYTECLAQVRPIGDIMGPGYTTEDRPWYELNFQLIL